MSRVQEIIEQAGFGIHLRKLRKICHLILLTALILTAASLVNAEPENSVDAPANLFELSLEELMNISSLNLQMMQERKEENFILQMV